MTVADWPENIWKPFSWSWNLEAVTATQGPGFNGRSTVFFTENRRWVGSVSLGQIWREAIPRHRAFINSLGGRSQVIRIPVCNYGFEVGRGSLQEFQGRIGHSNSEISSGSVPYSDGTTFQDGSGFALMSNGPIVAKQARPAGAVDIQLQGDLASFMSPGAFFSINDFLYEVSEVTPAGVKFHPPLREAVSSGAQVDYADPKILVRLSSDDGGRITQTNKIAAPITVNFEEVFQR